MYNPGSFQARLRLIVFGGGLIGALVACTATPTPPPSALPPITLPPFTATSSPVQPTASTRPTDLPDQGSPTLEPTRTPTATPAPPSPTLPPLPTVTFVPTATATRFVTPMPLGLTRNLSLQSPPLTGEDVRQLQMRLQTLHYAEVGEADGIFGSSTEAAVRHFQEVNDLTIDGVVGPETWSRLFSPQATANIVLPTPNAGTLIAQRALSLQSPALTGADIRQLQNRLRQLNYLGCHASALVVNGIFDMQTDSAVRHFQANNDLEANGIVGPEMWEKLLSAAAAPEVFGPVTLPPPVTLPSGKTGLLAVLQTDRRSSAQIFALDADLGTLLYPLSPADRLSVQPAWSPDGSRLAYIATAGEDYEVYVASGDGTGAVRLTCTQNRNKSGVAWAPDGAHLVFAARANGSAGLSLYIVNADGTGLRQLPVPPESSMPAWSRAGQIAFVSRADGDSNIYIINPDGSGLKALTSNSQQDAYPDWSPDGERLVFSSNRTGTAQLFVMNADGSDQHQLTNIKLDPNAVDPSDLALIDPDWSPDGGRIAFEFAGYDLPSRVGVVNSDGAGLVWYQIEPLAQPDWKP